MNCANCGNLLPPGARVCPNCGTPVPTTIPASSPNIPPSEQTGYGNFGSFQEARPTIPNSPVNQDKTVRQNPAPAPQDSSSMGYGIPAMPQEQFQFPDQSSFAAEQFNQPYQSYQQPLQSSSPQQPFASSMPPQQPLFPGATPQQLFPGNPSPHFSDTTQQDIPASNPPSFPGMPPQQPPFAGQAEQYGQPGQQWQPGQPGQFGQAAQPGQQWQPGQPAPLKSKPATSFTGSTPPFHRLDYRAHRRNHPDNLRQQSGLLSGSGPPGPATCSVYGNCRYEHYTPGARYGCRQYTCDWNRTSAGQRDYHCRSSRDGSSAGDDDRLREYVHASH